MRPAAIENMPPFAKGKATDLPAIETLPTNGRMFDAILFPNRSLPNAGFVVVMSIVIGVNLTLGLVFYSIGAWPVLGFCGLDIFLVWLAFKLSYRQGRLHERVRVEPGEMLISRVLPSGHETRWRLQPFWTRVIVDHAGEHEARVRVVSKGRSLVLGAFLSPTERDVFAKALARALETSRTVRVSGN